MKSKHILFIVENKAVPYDIRVWKEALTVKEWGNDVSIISRKEKGADRPFEILNGISVYRHRLTAQYEGKLGYFYEYLNALVCEAFLALKIFFRKPFHIIHAANPPDTISIIGLLFKIVGVKYIFDHHDLAPELYIAKFSKKKDVMHRILTYMEKLSCGAADVIISTNESFKKIIIKRHRTKSEKIFIVRNDPIIETDLNEKNQHINQLKRKATILYLGSINNQDGVDVLVKSLYYLVHSLNEKGFMAIIIGDGDFLYSVKLMIKQLDLNNYVKITGYIFNRERISSYLSEADICVEPAPMNQLNQHSTFIKIMEYMASKKPVVAFDLKETRYSTNGCAMLVEPGSIKSFAKAIKTLIDDPDLRDKLGSAALRRIQTELNWDNAASNLKKAYNAVQAK